VVEEFDGAGDHGGSGDRASLGRKLVAQSADGVELGLERREVSGFDRPGQFRRVPPGTGFGEAGGAAGGAVRGDVQEGVRGMVGGPAAAADGQVERGQQVRS